MDKRGSALIILIVVVLIIVIIGIAWVIWQTGTTPAGTSTPGTSAPTSTPISLHPIAATTTPLGIPGDLPLPADAQIVYNGSLSSSTASNYNPLATQESVRSYITKQTAAQLYTSYANYFKNANWNVVSSLNQGGIKSIDAKNKYIEDEVSITINPLNSATLSAKSMVSITAVFRPIIVSGTLMLGPQPNP